MHCYQSGTLEIASNVSEFFIPALLRILFRSILSEIPPRKRKLHYGRRYRDSPRCREDRKIFYQLFNQGILKMKNFFYVLYVHANVISSCRRKQIGLRYDISWFKFSAGNYKSIKWIINLNLKSFWFITIIHIIVICKERNNSWEILIIIITYIAFSIKTVICTCINNLIHEKMNFHIFTCYYNIN